VGLRHNSCRAGQDTEARKPQVIRVSQVSDYAGISRAREQMRIYSSEFRLEVVRRILKGEKVAALAEELGIHRKVLYEWVRRVKEGGESNLRARGRPPKSDAIAPAAGGAARRIAELERMVGRQQLAIEFFKHALQRIEELRQKRSATGATASSNRSRK
jgi:transposase